MALVGRPWVSVQIRQPGQTGPEARRYNKGEFTKAKALKSQHEQTLHPNMNLSKAQSLVLVEVLIPASKGGGKIG